MNWNITTSDHTNDPMWVIEYGAPIEALVQPTRLETRRWVIARLRRLMWSGIVVEAERVLREVQE